LIVAFVAVGLGHKLANPSFDVGRGFQIVIVRENVGIFDEDIDHRGILKVLTEAANSNAITTMTCDLKATLAVHFGNLNGRVTFWTKISYDPGLIAMQSSPPW
jgi:hypothetical protein